MKNLLPTALVGLTLAFPYNAIAKEVIVALSPYQNKMEAKAQAKMILQNLTQLDPGDQATLIDGYHLKTLGVFNIPQKKAYASAKARLRVNRKTVGALMRFSKQAKIGDNGFEPSVSGAVRLPQVLRYVADNHASSKKQDVIILGSPFYDDPRDPGFSMADGRFPSDAHLTLSRAQTPFGTADAPDHLSNIQVHFCYGDEALMRSDRHKFYIHRFWTLYIEKSGGRLMNFTADCASMFRQIRGVSKPQRHNFRLKTSAPFSMVSLQREEIAPSIYERRLSNKQLALDVIEHAKNIEIGLSWDCAKCDLDLYAQSAPDTSLIYFGNNDTNEGKHRKDFLTSPLSERSFETISFHVPVDLSKLKIAVNFYKGNAPHGVRGELRISTGNKTYATRFKIEATSGNKGLGVREVFQMGKEQGDHILMIDPLRVIGAK